MTKVIVVVLSLLVLSLWLWEMAFPKWFFSDYYFRVGKIIVTPFIYCWLITGIVDYKIKHRHATVIILVWGLLLASFIVYINLRPIDSNSERKDILVLKNIDNNKKVIIQEYFNYKHNRRERDTVTVKEVLLFRKYLK